MEKFRQGFCLAQRIEEYKLTEQPLLQCDASLVTLLLQSLYMLLPFTKWSFILIDALLPGLFQSTVLGLLELALSDKMTPPILPVREGVSSNGIALRLASFHKFPVGRKLCVHLLAKRGCGGRAVARPYKGGNLTVDVADGGLFLLEVTAGSHEVEDRRHEVFMLCLAIERAGEGGKIDGRATARPY